MAQWWEEAPRVDAPSDSAPASQNWWKGAPEVAAEPSSWQKIMASAKNYAGDVLTGKYVQQGLQNLTGAYQWNPEISPLENARAAVRDPASIAQATNIALALTPGPIAAVRPPTPPTAVQLKAAGGAGFDAARNLGVDFQGGAVANMGEAIRSALDSKGLISERAPETHGIINRITNPPAGGIVTTDGLQALREALSSIRQSGASAADRNAAGQAIRSVDDFITAGNPSVAVPGTATPDTLNALADTWADARANYAAAQRSNDITGALDRANTGITDRAAARAAAANSGTNIDNALRQRVASFLQRSENVSGYTDQELNALKEFVEGSAGRNALRNMANFMGGGRGMLGAGWGALGGGVGASLGGPVGAAAGAAAPVAVAAGLKAAQNRAAMKQMAAIDDLLRSRSPLYQEMLKSPPLPGVDKQALLLRALQVTPQMWGAFAPPQPQPSR